MQFTQVKKILKVYTGNKTNTNSSQLNRERAYLSEIFLELEGINDLVKDMRRLQMRDWVKDVLYLGLIAVGLVLLVIIGDLIT